MENTQQAKLDYAIAKAGTLAENTQPSIADRSHVHRLGERDLPVKWSGVSRAMGKNTT